MHKSHSIFTLSLISLACVTSAFAAKPVDLSNRPAAFMQTLLAPASANAAPRGSMKEISRHVDFNHVTHIRVQQIFAGQPVWNADAVVHVPNNEHASLTNLGAGTTMNGVVYQGLEADLAATPGYALSPAQADKALQQGIQLHQKKTGIAKADLDHAKKTLIVYIDKNNKAHWAYLVSFLSGEANGTPAVPTYILDATSLAVWEEWNDLQTLGKENVNGGGFGGNPKLGKLTYDGLTGNYPDLDMQRDAKKNLCYLQNQDVTVKDDTNAGGPFSNAPTAKFACTSKDSQHNNVYWDGDQDAKNGGYSPVNDSLYIGAVVKNMYQEWYNVPVLSIFGFPLDLIMHAHAKDLSGQPMDNAYFLSLTMQMYFGDGVKLFYPLTSLGVGAHELSHGFTSQHSNLTYEKQSGGLNESYSDMAAQAAEFYSTGKNSWQIGPEIVKGEGALRYMDDPTKDGKSIANVKDYNDDLNVHYSSGIFNKVFYLMGTASGWNTRKAFDVMVKANMDYWTANSTFADAACGVAKATKDYNYDIAAVSAAMNNVGLDISHC